METTLHQHHNLTDVMRDSSDALKIYIPARTSTPTGGKNQVKY